MATHFITPHGRNTRNRLWIISLILVMLGLAASVHQSNAQQQQIYGQAYQNGAYGGANYPAQENVLFILDASDSMNERISGNQTKIQAAKDVIFKTIQAMPPNVNIGLRVYGHKLGSGGLTVGSPFGMFMTGGSMCKQSELMVPLGIDNRAQIGSTLLNVEAVGKTPITYSLSQAVQNDFYGHYGHKTIILVSDGRETCSYNPCDLALEMVRSGVDVKINTIGFGTHDKVADDQLRCVAATTKGRFYSANTAAELAHGLEQGSQVQTSVQAQIHP